MSNTESGPKKSFSASPSRGINVPHIHKSASVAPSKDRKRRPDMSVKGSGARDTAIAAVERDSRLGPRVVGPALDWLAWSRGFGW